MDKLWIVFLVGVALLLWLDIKVFHKREHAVTFPEALKWSLFWIGISVGFGLLVTIFRGVEVGAVWFTGYIIEKSLSIDNLFVFLVLLTYFKVPGKLHHKVLFWGIVGAILIRGIFIVVGMTLIELFEPILFVMGGFLIFTGYKIFKEFLKEFQGKSEKKTIEEEGKDLISGNPIIKFISSRFPLTKSYEGDKFSVVKAGKRFITPLFLVLIAVETTDVVFAADSLPAVIAISKDPFIVFTSNIAAVLGLRALFFLVESLIGKLPYLPLALAFALGFIGVKMLLPLAHIEIPIGMSVAVILGVISLSIGASLILKPKK